MNDVLINVNKISFGYRDAGHLRPVITDVSFSVSLGDFIVLEGVNGSGKTTLLRGILGFVPAIMGNVVWGIRRGEIGYIPQEATLDSEIPATALDIVRTAAPVVWANGKSNALEALEMVGMKEKAKIRFGSLSGGQKRRVLLAKALAGQPKLLFLDEPTVNVDRDTEKAMEALITDLCEKKTVGVIAVTHARHWADHAKRFKIEKGRLYG
ncbi:MAG: ATP-binding cassette domain-containing protein [bacterium]